MNLVTTRLSNLCKVITKGTTPTSIGYSFSDSGIVFLRVQNINGGKVNYDQQTLFIDELTHKTLSRSQILAGDILVSIAGTIGRAGIVPDNAPPLNCNQAVAIVRTNEDIFRPYLRHWLESNDAQSQMIGATVTGTISNLSLTQIGNLQVPLPPLEEQKRIAEILDRSQSLISKRREAIAQLNTLTQAIFLEMFGSPDSILNLWKVKKLGDLLDFLTTGSRGWAAHYAESGDLFLRIQNVRWDELVLNDIAFVKTPQTVEARRTKVEPGDVLLSMTADLGRTAVIPEDIRNAYINQHLAILRTKSIHPQFLSSYFASPSGRRQVQGRNRQAVKAGLNFDDVRSFMIPCPPNDLQKEFARRVEAVEKLKAAHRASLSELDALFASLQNRAFRGEL